MHITYEGEIVKCMLQYVSKKPCPRIYTKDITGQKDHLFSGDSNSKIITSWQY